VPIYQAEEIKEPAQRPLTQDEIAYLNQGGDGQYNYDNQDIQVIVDDGVNGDMFGDFGEDGEPDATP
jgi:hypothetical protein